MNNLHAEQAGLSRKQPVPTRDATMAEMDRKPKRARSNGHLSEVYDGLPTKAHRRVAQAAAISLQEDGSYVIHMHLCCIPTCAIGGVSWHNPRRTCAESTCTLDRPHSVAVDQCVDRQKKMPDVFGSNTSMFDWFCFPVKEVLLDTLSAFKLPDGSSVRISDVSLRACKQHKVRIDLGAANTRFSAPSEVHLNEPADGRRPLRRRQDRLALLSVLTAPYAAAQMPSVEEVTPDAVAACVRAVCQMCVTLEASSLPACQLLCAALATAEPIASLPAAPTLASSLSLAPLQHARTAAALVLRHLGTSVLVCHELSAAVDSTLVPHIAPLMCVYLKCWLEDCTHLADAAAAATSLSAANTLAGLLMRATDGSS